MTQTTAPAPGTTRDSDGFAPGTTRACDQGDDCRSCAGLGWVLCDHHGAEIEFDLHNADGYLEWCTRCSAPVDGLTWTWCPQRAN